MKKSLDSLVINPLYYDLLSGEFRPVSDTLQRTHTMARLAVATFTKGEWLDRQVESDLQAIDYVPSWAPNVTSSVLVDQQNSDYNNLINVSLAITGQYNSLDIDLLPDEDEPQIRIRGEGEEDAMEFPLELGPGLDDIRAIVAGHADYVFSRAHNKQQS